MRIERIGELELSPPDEAQVAELLARCFATDFGGRSYFIQRHHLRFVVRDPGIVGHMGLTFRVARLGQDLVPVLGLADVATDPARRGEGIAARLLGDVIAWGRSSPADFLLLFGTAGIYAGAGCTRAANPMRYVDMTGARTHAVRDEPAESLMVLPLTPGAVWDDALPLDLLGHLF
jgi:predicted N-acetyltransferase YhbS